MGTPFLKMEAMIKLKRYLAHRKIQETTVRDCFPTDMMEWARHLASYGAHLRRTEEGIQRYHQASRYQDQEVDKEALKELIAGIAENQKQRPSDKGKTGPKHTAKNRQKSNNKKSSGKSSPMATDNDDECTQVNPVTSSNAVPQGQHRTTTNLTAAGMQNKLAQNKGSDRDDPM
jgi:hypothetical protein